MMSGIMYPHSRERSEGAGRGGRRDGRDPGPLLLEDGDGRAGFRGGPGPPGRVGGPGGTGPFCRPDLELRFADLEAGGGCFGCGREARFWKKKQDYVKYGQSLKGLQCFAIEYINGRKF